MDIPNIDEIIEQSDQTEARAEALASISKLAGGAYPNKFVRSRLSGREDSISNLLQSEPVAAVRDEIKKVVTGLEPGTRPPAEVKDALNARLRELGEVRVAGRLTTPPRGNFVHLTDGASKLQLYCKKGAFSLIKNDASYTLDAENGWAAWQLLDHGDFVGASGYLFVTNTGEVSVHVEALQFLAKALVPMPDKMHGIADPELRRRYRYADLIASSLQVSPQGLTTREIFERRAKIISSMRHFLDDHGYIEVETPMLTPKATGAAAKPFKTHHNALDIDLYARIAPELYLKRLVVGGFEKVYELNRNFRNEGISYKHNPEFTMLEFYCAYMDVERMMNFCEEMMRESVLKAAGNLKVNYENIEIDFSIFRRISMKDSVVSLFQNTFPGMSVFSSESFNSAERLNEIVKIITAALSLEVASMPAGSHVVQEIDTSIRRVGLSRERTIDKVRNRFSLFSENVILEHAAKMRPGWDSTDEAKMIQYLFESLVEETLDQPTFIVDYPKSISPLSKASPADPKVAERFELFINGMEIANGFSELNDPIEQYERFVEQMSLRTRGDEEAMEFDEDYIRALSYGMPPAAGIGIGIDRLVMLLTNKHSIRDVILFPHMRPEKMSGGDAE